MVSWNGMISQYVEIGLLKEAVDVFHRMQVEGVRPNYLTLVSILPAISRIGAFELGKWVHLYAEQNGIVVDDVLGSALVLICIQSVGTQTGRFKSLRDCQRVV